MVDRLQPAGRDGAPGQGTVDPGVRASGAAGGRDAGGQEVSGVVAEPGLIRAIPIRPEFSVELRGYRREDVDALLTAAEEALHSVDPAVRAATVERIRSTTFEITLRGYSKPQIDDFLTAVLTALRD